MNARTARIINRYARRFGVKPRELKRRWQGLSWRARTETRLRSMVDLLSLQRVGAKTRGDGSRRMASWYAAMRIE